MLPPKPQRDLFGCPGCGQLVFWRGAHKMNSTGTSHYCANRPASTPADDIVECICGTVVGRDSRGRKWNYLSGVPHVCKGAPRRQEQSSDAQGKARQVLDL